MAKDWYEKEEYPYEGNDLEFPEDEEDWGEANDDLDDDDYDELQEDVDWEDVEDQ